jgi:MFS family permease
VAVGWLDTLIGRFQTLILAYTLTTVGLVMLWLLPRYPTPWLLFGFLVCFGCTIGSRGPLITATAMQIFRGKHLGAIFGTISIGPGLGASIGAWIGGLIHDFTQGYDWVIVFAIASVWLGALPFFTERALRNA